jgi:ParB-like chromosome segregation protein Spo0J
MTSIKKPSWRDYIKIHPEADKFPKFEPDELRSLGEDIQKNGLKAPLTLYRKDDGEEELLDGRNRLDALEAIGVPVVDDQGHLIWKHGLLTWNTVYASAQSPIEPATDPKAFVISANVLRRHLDQKQKRDLIAEVLKDQPNLSDRAVAKKTKVSDKTVGAVRRELEDRAEIPHAATRTDSKGRQQQVDRTKAKQQRRAEREAELAAKQAAGNLDLPDKRYGVIYADPEYDLQPWSRDTGNDARRPIITRRVQSRSSNSATFRRSLRMIAFCSSGRPFPCCRRRWR